MIVVSMLLVVAGFVALLLGVLNVGIGDLEPIMFVYGAIGACVLAGLALVVGVLRSRPRDRPVTAGGQASWSGAAGATAPERAGAPVASGERAGASDEPAPAMPSHVRVEPRPAAPEAPAPGSGAPAEEISEPAGAEEAPVRPRVEPPPAERPAPEAPAPPGDADAAARLREVPGVGPARQRALLEHFGSVGAIAAASVEELAAVKGVSENLARRIHERLRR